MSPRPLAFATVLAVSAALAAPAAAWPFGRDRNAEQPAETPQAAPANAPAAPDQATRRPANAQQREQAGRLDALSRAVFWAAEVSINPSDIDAYVALSQAQRELRRYDEAARSADQALVIQPNSTAAMMMLARARIAQGQGFYAIAPLEQVRAARPNDWEPLSLLGVAYQQVQRNDEARQVWTQALALSPENPAVLTNMALAMAGDGQVQEAESLMRRAVAQPGATIQTRLNLALMLGLQGREAEAEQILRRELPPEQVQQNLDWLRRTSSPAPAPQTTPTGGGRTWDALRGG